MCPYLDFVVKNLVLIVVVLGTNITNFKLLGGVCRKGIQPCMLGQEIFEMHIEIEES